MIEGKLGEAGSLNGGPPLTKPDVGENRQTTERSSHITADVSNVSKQNLFTVVNRRRNIYYLNKIEFI